MKRLTKVRTVKWLLLCSIAFLFTATHSVAQTTATASGNWSSPGIWSTGTVPVSGTAVIINPGITVTVDITNAICASLQVGSSSNGNGTLTFNTNSQLTVSGTVTLGGGSGARTGTINMTNGGTLSCNALSINSGGSVFTPGTGTVRLNATNTLPSSIITTFNNLVIGGGTTTASIALNIGSLTIASGATFVGGALTHNISRDWINNGGTFSNTGSTINFNGTSQSIGGSAATTFNHVTTVGATNTSIASGTTINGNLSIGNGTAFTADAFPLTVNGNLIVGGGTSGTFSINSVTGAKTFNGDVTVNAGATFNNTAGNASLSLAGNLSNTGTFNAGTGVYTLTGVSKTVSGTISIPNVTVAGSYTNNGTLTVTNALEGTGSLLNTGTLNLNFAGQPAITTLIASTAGNTVNYAFSGDQTVLPINYQNLTLGGSGAKTLQAGTTTIGGNFTLSGLANVTAVTGLTIGGSVTLGAGTLFTAGTFTHNVGGNWTNNGATFSSSGTINFNGTNQTIGGTAAVSYNNISTSGTANVTTGAAVTINGNLTIGNGTTFTAGGFPFTVFGSSVIGGGASGSLVISSASGGKTFTGDVTVNAGASWNNSGNAPVTFEGNLVNTGIFTTGTGIQTLSGTGKSLTGTFSIPAIAISGSYTNNNTLTITAALNGSGSLANAATGTVNINFAGSTAISALDATSVGNTVNYGFAGVQTIFATNYHHLNLSGSGTKTLQPGTTFIGGNLILSGTAATTTAADLAIGGNLTVGDGTSVTAAGFAFTVGGNTVVGGGVSGTLVIGSSIGAKSFAGDVTVNAGAAWNNSGNADVSIGGNVSTAGTFTAGTGTYTLSGPSNIISGTFSFSAVNISGSYTNNGTVTLTSALNGTGSLTNAAAGILNINFGGTPGLGALTATAVGNTVNYGFAGAQTIVASSYHHLMLGGSGAKTLQAGTTTIGGNFTLSGLANVTAVTGLTIGGSVTLGAGTLFTAGTFTHNVGGNWTNNGATFSSSGTINFNGASSSINGTATGQTFNHLTISKNAGQALTLGGSTTSLNVNNLTLGSGSFTAPATLTASGNLTLSAGTYLAGTTTNVAGNWINSGGVFTHNNGTVTLTGSSQSILGSNTFYHFVKSVATAATLTFEASQTQTIAGNVTLNGASGNLLSLSSSIPGMQWRIDPQGARNISFISVSNSNNLNSSVIAANSSTDGGSNTNWVFVTAQSWTGAVSTAWENAANWSPATLPNYLSDVIIPASPGGGRFPLISGGTQNVRTLTIHSGATVNQTGGILQLNNDWKNSGTYNATGGTVQFLVSGTGDANFSTGTNSFFHVIINSGIDPKFSQYPGSAVSIAGNYTNNNTSLPAQGTACTFTFNGTGDQTITNLSTTNDFGNLVINKGSGTLLLGSNLKVAGNLTVTGGSFSTSAGNYSLLIGGSAAFNGGSFNMNESTVSVSGNWTNSGCSISGNGNVVSIAGDYTRNNGSLSSPNSTFSVGGHWTNNSSGSFSAGTIAFTGTTKTIGGTAATAFPVLSVTGSVVMNTSCTATSLLLPSVSTASSLTLANGVTLTVNGNVSIQQPTALVTAALNVNGGTATINGHLTIGGANTTSGRIAKLALTTGALNVTGNIVFNSAATTPQNAVIDQTGGANTVSLFGNLVLTNGSGTITPGSSSSFIYNGSGEQQLQDASTINYNNLIINKPAGTLTLATAFTTTGSFVLQNGSFSTGVSSFSLDAGEMTLQAGTFEVNGSTVTINGNYTNNGAAVNGGTCAFIINGDYTRNGGTETITNRTLTIGGNWVNNTASAWAASSVALTGTAKTIGGTVATAFPSLTITTGTITANLALSCTALTFANDNVVNSLTLANGVVLTVNGDLTINQSTGAAVAHSLNVNDGTVSVSGNVTLNVTTNLSGNLARIVITNGILNITGNLVMNNTLLAANSLINMSGGAGNINLSGNLTVNSLGTMTSSTASMFTYTGGANQTLRQPSSFSYNIIRVNKSGGVLSIPAAFTTTGSLQLDMGTFSTAGFGFTAKNVVLNGGTLSAGNSTVTVNGSWTNNGGTYTTTGTTAMRSSGDINGSSQTTFARLLIGLGASRTITNNNSCTSIAWESGAGSASFTHVGSAALQINGTVTLQQPTGGNTNSWNINNGTATATGMVTFAGTDTRATRIFRLVITNGTLNAFGGITMVASSNTGKVIDMSGGAGTLNLKGALTAPANSGTLTAGTAGSIFNYADDANSQTINFFPAGAYHNLHISNTSSGGATLSAAISATNVTGNLRILSGKGNNNGLAIALSTGKTFEVANGATFVLGGTSGMVTGTSITKTFGVSSTVNYAGTTQTVTGENYGHLTISGSGTKTLGASATVNGTLTLTAGSFTLGATTLTLNGAVATNGGTWTGGCSSNITIGGSGANTTLPGISVNNFILNRATGISISGDLTVCGLLTLTNGIIKTNSFTVIMTNSTGAVNRTSGHVNGNLRKNVTTGTNVVSTFEVGGSLHYSPVVVTFASVLTGGTLTAVATPGDHPNINTSTVDLKKSAARYWTLTNSATTFTSYSAVFTFATADLDAGSNTANFIAGRYSGGTWSYPTVGTRTITSTQVTGLTAFGDFQFGEFGNNSIKTWTGGASTLNWGDAANWNPVGVPTSGDIVDLGGAHTININVNAVSNDLKLYNSGLVLTINSGISYAVNGNLSITAGTLNTAQAFPTVSGTVLITGGTVGYTAASGSQSVAAYEYNNLTISGGGTKTLAGNVTPAGNLALSGGTFDLGAFTCDRDVNGGSMTIASGATLKVGGSNSLPLNYAAHSIASGSTIEYSGSNQAVAALNSAQSYGNLVVSGTGIKTIAANIGAGNVTIIAATLDASSYNLTVTGNWVNNSTFNGGTGVITFGGNSTVGGTKITTFKNLVVSGTLTAPSGTMNVGGNFTNNGTFLHNNGTVNFNGSSLIDGSGTTTFNNVITSGQLTAPSGTMNIAGDWINTGSFMHNSGTVNFNGSNPQTLPAIDFHNLTSSSTGARVLPATGVVSINGAFTPGTNSYSVTGSTVSFVSESAQLIPAFTFHNLSLSGYLATKTAAANFSVNGQMDIDDSATLNMGTFMLGGTLSAVNGIGFVQTQNTSATPLPNSVVWETDVLYNSTAAQTIVTGNYNMLNASGGNRTLAAGTVAVAGVFNPGAGTYITTGNTVEFNGLINQTVPVLTYNNLLLSGAGTTKTAAGNLVVNGSLTTSAGVILEMAAFTLSGTVTSVNGSGTVRTANTTATPIPSGKTWTGDVDYYSASGQTIVSGTYGNLTASGGSRTLAAGVIGISNVFTPGSGAYTTTGSTVVFNGATDQNIPAFTFQNLTIAKSGGLANLLGDITVNGTLTFTARKIVTGNYKVIVSSTGTVTGAAQNTGWVEGNLQRHFANATNVSRTFDIGGTLYYTPVAVNIASVTTAGSLIARAVSTDHPSIGTSVISSTRNVNRYWNITNSGVVFTTASVTLNWNSADVDATADPVFFQVARFSSSVWSQPVQANPLTTSIEATGLTVFGDFVAGELLNVTRWTGALSTDWNTAGNWTPSAIPVATNNITIPGTATLYPVISSGTTAIKDLVIEASASLTVSGATLQISGSISNEGTFTATNGSIEFNGTLSQSIPSGVFATNTIKDLIVNNGSTVTLQDTLKLTNLLSVKKGSLVTKGFLTLKSTATGTARVDVITSAAATPINGAVTVERYVQGRRRYRLMTSPVTTSSSNTLTTGQEALSIWAAWQNSGSTLVSNYGTFITGGTAADGFDTQVSGASMYTYDASNRRWVGFTSAIGKNTRYTPLKAGVAYYMFVYGDRKNSLSSSTPNYTVLSATGTLLSGTQTYNTASSIALNNTVGGFTLLGNPFASPINWASLPKTNLENTYWGWDPNLSGTGGYVTVSTAGGTTLIAPFSGTVGLNQYIQSGQGFFVRTTAASPELQIRESDKTGTYNGNAFRKSNETKRTGDVNNPNSIPLLAMNVFYENSGSKILADGALMAFDASFNKGVGAEDAIKMFPSTESISVVNGSDFVSIDGRPLPSARDTVRLAAYRLTKPQYTFEIFAQQLQDKNVHAYLEDTYLNTKQALNLLDTNRILVNVNTSIPASADVNRFRILFEPLISLPVQFERVGVTRKEKKAVLDWVVSEDATVEKYIVERSADAVHFSLSGEVAAKKGQATSGYTWADESPIKGVNYYRLQMVQSNGKTTFSKTVSVQFEQGNASVVVFPNPVVDGSVNLRFDGVKDGLYTMTLYNKQGQALEKKVLTHTGSSAAYTFKPLFSLPAGVYYLTITSDAFLSRKEIIIQK